MIRSNHALNRETILALHTCRQPTKTWQIALLILVPLAANLPALTGFVNCDPEIIYSGLARNLSASLIPGNACFLDATIGYITQPLGYLSAQDWLHGIIPWWNPYSGVGMPLAAEMQTESFFLPFVLLLHFKFGWLYQRIILQILTGFFTYTFLRARQLHDIAALTGGLLFALNGSFFLHAGAASCPIFCLPLTMLGVERLAQAISTQQRGGWSLITAGLALSIYGGFPEIAFLNGLLVVFWVMVRSRQLPRPSRLLFLQKTCLAAAIGIVMTAPIVIPFLQYLNLANLGAHHGIVFARSVLPDAGRPIAIFPDIYGALGLYVPPVLEAVTGDLWVKFGGWIGCLPTLFALAALIRGDQDRPARYLFAAWLIAWFARDCNFLDVAWLFNLVPGIAHADVIRFSWIAREFAAYILTAYGVNDLIKCRGLKPYQIILLICLFSFCIVISIFPALPIFKIWFSMKPALRPYTATYLGLCLLASMIAIYGLVTGRLTRLMPTGIILGAVAIFLIPQFAAPRGGTLDTQAISKLKSLSNLSRFYTIGPFGPNIPAAYAIASINHSELPAPKLWTDFVTDNLFPGGNIIDFLGYQPEQIYGLISNLSHYSSIGVKYVLTAPNQNLADWQPAPEALTTSSGFVHIPGQSSISGTLSAPAIDTLITSASVFVQTFGGLSTGALNLQLCSGSVCTLGTIDVATIPHDARIDFMLDHPLQIRKDQTLTFKMTHPKGDAVAVFLTGGNGIEAYTRSDRPDNLYFEKSNAAPSIHYVYARSVPAAPGNPASLSLVYHDDLVNIYQLPGAAPYATATDPACALQILSRQHFKTNCPNAAVITRRELFYPGWQARINQHETLITKSADIFQSITIPAGPADIRFNYEPLHTHFACAIAILAALAWLILILRERRHLVVTP